MDLKKSVSIVEAILFASGDAVEVSRIAVACGIDVETIRKLINILNDRYDQEGSALSVARLDDCYQMVVKEEYYDSIKAALETKKNAPLSPAALEVLTIIAYNQPVTKGFVEHIRGIDSSSVVNSLVEKKLLEEAGRIDAPGRPIAYKTTTNFLRCFQLGSVEELPIISTNDPQISFDEILLNEKFPDETVAEE